MMAHLLAPADRELSQFIATSGGTDAPLRFDLGFGIWILGFFWDLGFGFWIFSPSLSPSLLSHTYVIPFPAAMIDIPGQRW